jgi:putative transposase
MVDRHRRSVRRLGHDYSRPGGYSITICTYDRECLFGEIVGHEVRLSEYGVIVEEEWRLTAAMRPAVRLDDFIVMPNHIHGILFLVAVGAHCVRPDTISTGSPQTSRLGGKTGWQGARSAPLRRPPASIPSLVAGFKSAVTRRIRALRHAPYLEVWQRGYNDHIIRGQEDLERHRNYIRNNPRRWAEDDLNPANSPGARRLRGDL